MGHYHRNYLVNKFQSSEERRAKHKLARLFLSPIVSRRVRDWNWRDLEGLLCINAAIEGQDPQAIRLWVQETYNLVCGAGETA